MTSTRQRPGSRLLSTCVPALLALLAACPSAAGGSDRGLMDAAYWEARQREYLEFATAVPLDPGSPLHVLNYLERERIDESFETTPGAVGADAWDSRFDKLWRLKDTSDFDLVYMMNVRYAFPDHPMIDPGLWEAFEDAVLSFKYWYTDPTPERLVDDEQVIDNMWYWTENHTLLFHTNELLAGMLYPGATFAVSGMTGAQHAARAREKILTWMEERARFGFTEWHSNVYYNLDVVPLITLIEHSGDAVIVEQATMVLDLLLLDVALHLHRGTFGATHGRSYAKDKASADTEDTFTWAKMLFDDTSLPYNSRAASGGSLIARSRGYRMPEVIRRIALSNDLLIDRQRMNVPVDEVPPEDYTTPIPPGPYGLDFTDEDRLPLWWSMGLLTTWPGMPLLLEVADREGLWVRDVFSDFAALREQICPEGTPFDDCREGARNLLAIAYPFIGFAVLKEVNTYTYRTPDYMLSTAQDYRKGLRQSQIHAWQATLGERAMVFTNHPGLLPWEGEGDPPSSWNWQDSDEPGPGYWTGEATQPRSAQHENVAIHIYDNSLYPSIPDFRYRQETHAYFPHAHFDEVVQQGKWTFGRYLDGYVALYSHRDTIWREGQPELFDNQGLPFDLVAPGSARNVWIVECGSASQWGTFEAFRSAIAAATVEAAPTKGGPGFDVHYVSPSLGSLGFGWSEPLVVNGEEVPIAGYDRHDNRYIRSEFDAQHYEVSDGSYGLTIDFPTRQRIAVPEPSAAALQLAAVTGLALRRNRRARRSRANSRPG